MHGHGVKTDPQGNIFEGEWREGKPQLTAKEKNTNGLVEWLNEAVANVTNIGKNKDYQTVSTWDDDDDRRGGRH